MPNSISLLQVAIWTCVGFFVSFGWHLGALTLAAIRSVL